MEALLARGADPGVINRSDLTTPLHDAAAGGFAEIAALLADAAPASVGARDEDGETPLHAAARGDHGPVVALLLAHGADPLARSASGAAPADEAEDAGVKRQLVAAAVAAAVAAREAAPAPA